MLLFKHRDVNTEVDKPARLLRLLSNTFTDLRRDYVTKGNQNREQTRENGLSEPSNFVCVLRGDVKYLEKIREHIEKVYVNSGLVTMIKFAVSSDGINLLTDAEWEEYQKLKEKDNRLIGAGFP